MSLVFPDGYVLDSIGPYLADGKNNDAGITEHILNLHGDLAEWLSEGDVCVDDRALGMSLIYLRILVSKPKCQHI